MKSGTDETTMTFHAKKNMPKWKNSEQDCEVSRQSAENLR